MKYSESRKRNLSIGEAGNTVSYINYESVVIVLGKRASLL